MTMTMQYDEAATTTTNRPPQERDLICGLEGVLRSVTPARAHTDDVRFDDELDAKVVAGPFSQDSLTGLEQFTVSPDGTVLLRGTHAFGAGAVSLELRGFVVPSAGDDRAVPKAITEPGFEFPDEDLRLSGSALLRASAPGYERFDGALAAIEGWLNFASGELELEAWAM